MTEQAVFLASAAGTGVEAGAGALPPAASSATSGAISGASSTLPPAPNFSWGGYFEAIGIMLLLLGLLWLAA